ncbi:MazG nucleotide pyrophosphohydrolase domain-containing protein [Actinopolyspora lacussalsi subsp. righensis]|uniref:MazG nucleotide pyrophosphohydrolase domain-containing protein n=1 Tax=Actinopolyspora righensis TaxID=995060 RepID=A0A1I7BG80_9ACTN|nr:MazG nucleotide pyrophosphohydrolase domain-containing protein [Actinopolyspora righensis]SFT86152.1 MazG nucleotide pyrophosphohydrolase domain-containing protein [Actinopolyspora righensis]
MRPLPAEATLAEIQRYVAEMELERGFTDSTVLEQSLKLGEEYGELCKAIRKRSGLAVEAGSATSNVGDELADIFIYLCAIANRLDTDLDQALRAKERVNETRTWTSVPREPATTEHPV